MSNKCNFCKHNDADNAGIKFPCNCCLESDAVQNVIKYITFVPKAAQIILTGLQISWDELNQKKKNYFEPLLVENSNLGLPKPCDKCKKLIPSSKGPNYAYYDPISEKRIWMELCSDCFDEANMQNV